MSQQPLVEFTYDNIPALPTEAEAPAFQQNRPVTQQPGFGAPPAQPVFGIPEFENVARRNADGSFRMVEFVTIKTPGDNKAMPRHKVTDRIREMYRPYYEAWRRGIEMSPVGTPLEAWPAMDRAIVTACKAQNIFTVEQLAETADANLHRLPMGRTLKNRARDWLKIKADADAVDALSQEKEALRSGQKILEQQNEQLGERLRQEADAREQLEARLMALESAGRAPEQAETAGKAPADLGDTLDRKIDAMAAQKADPATKGKGGK